MTRAAGPLGRLAHYDEQTGTLDIGNANAALLWRRVAWTQVPAGRREEAAAALRAATARNLLPPAPLRAAAVRRRAAVRRLAARGAVRELVVRPQWRVVVGLGEETPSEVGLRLHATYGTPILPGTALKGVARSYARREQPGEYADYGQAAFGSEADRPASVRPEAAAVMVLDALPEPGPGATADGIAADVLNPHVADYYTSRGGTPPAEYLQPVPVGFLTVTSAVPFRVYLIARGPDPDVGELAVDLAAQWLGAALEEDGVGAKTAAGYGYMSVTAIEDGEWEP